MSTPQGDEPPDEAVRGLVEKTRAVAEKLGALKRDLADARRAAQLSQTREAVSRAELTAALHESLIVRAEQQARLRTAALTAFVARAKPKPPRRHNRLSKALDRLLARLGSPGQALVIARSGVWRGTGRSLFDLRHMAAYARRRARADVQPLAFLDQGAYLAENPDVAGAGTSPLAHYLTRGAAERRRPHPLFDLDWYAARHGRELGAHGLSPLEHFARISGPRGESPHPLFDVAHYLAQGPALAPGEHPAEHYHREGWRLGLSPHPLFDTNWYLRQALASEVTGSPLAHYLAGGWRRGLSPNPLFSPLWYLERHPEAEGREPLTHYVLEGGAEGLDPSPWFDTAHYVAQRGPALAPGANPLIDYVQGGAWAVAEPRPGFPTAAYLASHPELVAEGVTPLEHWARLGSR
jgi:hypothetical protein